MQFAFRDAPEWFLDHILKFYITELHEIQKAAKTSPDYDDEQFKQVAVEFFTGKGFILWLDEENKIWFDVDPDSAKWTFEILRN
jgi:hypothetical protein